MTPDEFWFGDPELFFNYVRVYERKQKEKSQYLWGIGARVIEALQCTPVVVGLANKQILRQMPTYSDCPYEEEQVEREYTDAEKRFLVMKLESELDKWINSYNEKY